MPTLLDFGIVGLEDSRNSLLIGDPNIMVLWKRNCASGNDWLILYCLNQTDLKTISCVETAGVDGKILGNVDTMLSM